MLSGIEREPSRAAPAAVDRPVRRSWWVRVGAGRWMGAGMLLAFGAGILSNFHLQVAIFEAPGFLHRASTLPGTVGTVVLLSLLTGLISLVVALLLRERFACERPLLTRLLLALAAAGLALSLIEATVLQAMRDLSAVFLAAQVQTGDAAATVFEPARQVLLGLRNGIHFTNKLLGGLFVAALFALLFWQRALPRALAAIGVVAAALMMITVGRELFGLDLIHALLAPLALVYPLTALWLLAVGFAPKAPAEAAD